MSKDSYSVKDLNPRSAAATQLRMTVQRAVELVEAFDELTAGQDWQDVPGTTYRRIIGERYMFSRMLEECWNRYKNGTLFGEIADLAANLPPSVRKAMGKSLRDVERRAHGVDQSNSRRRVTEAR